MVVLILKTCFSIIFQRRVGQNLSKIENSRVMDVGRFFPSTSVQNPRSFAPISGHIKLTKVPTEGPRKGYQHHAEILTGQQFGSD